MAVSQELLEILRCPYCVSGETRKPGDDPGLLELVRDGQWLVCQEPDCGRKYHPRGHPGDAHRGRRQVDQHTGGGTAGARIAGLAWMRRYERGLQPASIVR